MKKIKKYIFFKKLKRPSIKPAWMYSHTFIALVLSVAHSHGFHWLSMDLMQVAGTIKSSETARIGIQYITVEISNLQGYIKLLGEFGVENIDSK